MIAQRTETPSAAKPHRDDWPWAQLQRGDALRLLLPSVCFLLAAHTSFGTNLDSHAHSDAFAVRTLVWLVHQRLLFKFLRRILKLVRIHQAGPRTDSDRCGESSGTRRVCLRGAQRCYWTSRQRTTVSISLSPFNPNKRSNTAKMILLWAAAVLSFSGTFC